MISIIVPVYKYPDYLKRCLDSILRQTYKDFEAILVDDGSPDGCNLVCDKYSLTDTRFKVIHKENGGIASARKAGLVACSIASEWITFVDADDTLPPKALEYLLSKADNSTDIIIGWHKQIVLNDYIIEIEDYRRRCIANSNIHIAPWAHLYRHSILNSECLDFPRYLTRGEDLVFNMRVSFRTNKPVKIVHEFVYNYMYNKESVIHTYSPSIIDEERFHEYRKTVIPSNIYPQYLSQMVEARLRALVEIILMNTENTDWRDSIFYKELLEDIKISHRKLTLIERRLIDSETTLERDTIKYTRRIYLKIEYYLNRIIAEIRFYLK